MKELSWRKAAVILFIQGIVLTGLGLGLWNLAFGASAGFVTVDARQVVLGAALAAILTGTVYGLQRAFPEPCRKLLLDQARRYSADFSTLSWPLIVLISLSAGIGEEALFRGGLQTLLGGYVGPVAAILAANFLFALIHLARPLVLVILFMIGLFLALAFWWSGSLLAVMIAHALYDIWALGNMKRVVLEDRATRTDDTCPET